ncbi:Alpha-methylacyl-CoA racemase [Paraburkholderia unamae]|uniref:CaiB/BaiF CoA transferase family protein n=1 Tax=Paraburkholderia unamae TaxID=219649 RepID=UPI001CAD1DA7|nr:CaiB/BaiF CoA-transferase family protein [Paraburkholderia unamae]CAG9274532.1 Alpha-methylacyl-CoA racemase [Paraburkholderia unamae]
MIKPLEGVTVVEFAGLGPAPFCGMLLAQMGARVICIGREGAPPPSGPLARGREYVALDLKRGEDIARALDLIASADALIEGFRPGVMERLGLGPEVCHARRASLVYGRMTGWGQTGPLAHTAGHDINYIAISGALHAVGLAGGDPVVPLNLVGDFGGGGMLLAFGVVAAILRARAGGEGCVVDTAMTDGAAMLMSMIYGFQAAGHWQDARGVNLLDGGAPFYRTYRCADDRWIAVGCIEPQFYATFMKGIGAEDLLDLPQRDRAHWPRVQERIAGVIATRTRDEWAALFAGSDACVTPVLSLAEAPLDAHNTARGAFAKSGDAWAPECAPRFVGYGQAEEAK